MKNKELNEHQKAILGAISSHKIWGAYIAFCIPFAACSISVYLVNLISPVGKVVGIGLTVTLSIVFAVGLVASARRAKANGKI
jgi:hypothetical protein